ncbi:MAG: hypothetical protein OXM56_14610 [Gammaproteobacteria bacterium]|nr:hypothetical protein [Gammaproteobacteria bacterium]
MDRSPEPVTRADFEEFAARLHAEIERSAQTLRAEIQQSAEGLRAEMKQSAEGLRADISDVHQSVAGIAGELRILKWAVSLALAAIVGGLGMLYQGVTDLRTEMYSGDNALREEIADLGERTARLEEGQRHTHERLRNLTDLTRARALPPGAS